MPRLTALKTFTCQAHEGYVQKGAAFDTSEARALYLDARDFAEYAEDRPTKKDLYDRAQELDIEGRSDMTRDELAAAIAEHLSD